jgi:hypothetical protein
MSSRPLWFDSCGFGSVVCLPFDLEARLNDWQAVQRKMLRGPAPGFTRDEWAYLVGFVDRSVLMAPFLRTFGTSCPQHASPRAMFRPRGGIAVWLPNNASLLGPLVIVLSSLTGAQIRAKSGSRAEDLAQAFVEFCTTALEDCDLRRYLANDVTINRFSRDDPQNAQMSMWAASRIVFGSDEAATAVSALPHRADCRTFAFGDHRSEAWIDVSQVTDDAAVLLGRVFAIYGRAGCTSPSRVVLLGGSVLDACQLCQRLLSVWSRVSTARPAANIASECLMVSQLARAIGVRGGAWLAPDHGALLVADEIGGTAIPGMNVLPVMGGSVEQAVSSLPPNIQTIGYMLPEDGASGLITSLASTPVKRVVPLRAMHHFGPVWDGYSFWRELFEEVELA